MGRCVTFIIGQLTRAMEDGEQTQNDVAMERETVAAGLDGQLTEYELAVKLKKSARRSAKNCTRIATLNNKLTTTCHCIVKSFLCCSRYLRTLRQIFILAQSL